MKLATFNASFALTAAVTDKATGENQPRRHLANNPTLGYQQLVDAFDAAYMRLIQSNKYFDLLEAAGLTNLNLLVTDCYWASDEDLDNLYPYPNPPTGIFKDILDSEELKYADLAFPGPSPTLGYGKFLGDPLVEIVDLLETEYSTSKITLTQIVPPTFSIDANFANLADGTVDVMMPIGAIGGFFDDPSSDLVVRRNKAFIRSCSVAATDFQIWMQPESTFTDLQGLRNLGDSIKVCYFVQNSGLAGANLPEAERVAVFSPAPTKGFMTQAAQCSANVLDDTAGMTIAFMEFDVSNSNSGIGNGSADLEILQANQASPTASWVKNPAYWD